MTEKKNVLIIGGGSFVAKHFIVHARHDFNLKVVSRYPTGFAGEIISVDYSDIPETIFSGMHTVINFAAIVHKREKIPDEVYQKVNYQLAMNNAKKAKQQGVKHFVQISTVSVYGKVNSITHDTSSNPLDSYGKSKLRADNELMKMHDLDFKVTIIRPPLIYGGGNAPGNMMRLLRLVDKGLPLPFRGIDNRKDFLNITNFIEVLKKVVLKEASGIMLVSDNRPISTAKLIKIISEKLGKKPRLILLPSFMLALLKKLRPDEYDKLFGTLTIDCRKTFEKLEIAPESSVEDGIEEMTKWYLAHK